MPDPTDIPIPDRIDLAAGLEPSAAIFTLRRQREKVRTGAAGSHDALLDGALPGSLTRAERLAVCIYAATTSGAASMATHYRSLWTDRDEPELLSALDAALADGDLARLPSARAITLLTYARTLLEKPVHGDKAALEQLAGQGLDVADIVAVSQLLGFLSFQVRLVAGVQAMAALEAAR